ncbi:MAG: T9SS type A sorting domain-containing protein [Bacteroidia bacterium]|nr:T9SS type A sorting domain-containing protein [Bacteroidia bacterium]
MAIGIGRANQWNRLFSRNLMIRLHLKNSAGTSIQDAYRSDSFSLSQNYPNPFTDQTGINYSLDREANVRLEITDLTGQVVLMKDEGMRPVGSHRLEIQNPGLAPGIYFYTLYARQNRETKKMVIMEKY